MIMRLFLILCRVVHERHVSCRVCACALYVSLFSLTCSVKYVGILITFHILGKKKIYNSLNI